MNPINLSKHVIRLVANWKTAKMKTLSSGISNIRLKLLYSKTRCFNQTFQFHSCSEKTHQTFDFIFYHCIWQKHFNLLSIAFSQNRRFSIKHRLFITEKNVFIIVPTATATTVCNRKPRETRYKKMRDSSQFHEMHSYISRSGRALYWPQAA